MMMKIILGIFMLPVLLIMYVVMRGIEKENGSTLFGVTLWKEAKGSSRIQEMKRQYRKCLNLWMSMFLLCFVLTMVPRHFSIYMILQIIWVFGVIFLSFVPYIRMNRRMMEWKQEYQESSAEAQEQAAKRRNVVYVDVTAAKAEKPKFFEKQAAVSVLAALFPILAEPVWQRSQKNPADLELWISELLLCSMAAVCILLWFCIRYYNRMTAKAVTSSSQLNIQLARMRQYQWGRVFCVISWLTCIFNWILLISFHMREDRMFPVLLIGSLLYSAAIIVLGFQCFWRVWRIQRKYLENSSQCLTDDDEHWIWGIFYYNKEDSRFMVEQRIGMGFTTNMANKKALILSVGVLGATIIFLLVMCAWLILDDFTPVSLYYEDHTLAAAQWKEEYSVSKEDIISVELLEKEPVISKKNGSALDTVKKGKFFSREYERRFEVCINPKEPPYLMIETRDGTWYLLGGSEGEVTRKIYRQLTENGSK